MKKNLAKHFRTPCVRPQSLRTILTVLWFSIFFSAVCVFASENSEDISSRIITAGEDLPHLLNPTLRFESYSVSKKQGDPAFSNPLTAVTDGALSFSSDNTKVAVVDASTGTVSIKGPGKAIITVNAAEGKSYCAGIDSYTLRVAESQKSFSACVVTIDKTSFTYDGSEKKPSVTVKDGETVLMKDRHYTVSYKNNTNAGKATVTVTGMDIYEGSQEKNFSIVKTNPKLSFALNTVTKKVADAAFTNTLTRQTDGSVTFSSGDTSVATVNADTGKVTIRGAGKTVITAKAAAGKNYNARSVSYTLTILSGKLSLSGCTVTLSNSSYTYNGKEKRPKVTVKRGSETLTLNTDFSVAYTDNINAGTATVTLTGLDPLYYGTVKKTYTIAKASPTLRFDTSYVPKKTGDAAFINSLKKITDGTVTFSSSETTVAAVNSNTGKVTVKSIGEATITANAAAGKNYKAGSASFTVQVTMAGDKEFTWGIDNWNFNNEDFGDYTIESHVKEKLLTDFELSNAARSRLESNISNSADEEWLGSCYGMVVSEILAKQGYLDLSKYGGKKTVYSNEKTTAMKSVINFIQLLQLDGEFCQNIRQASILETNKKHRQSEYIEALYNELKNNDSLLSVTLKVSCVDINTGVSTEGYHSVLAYGVGSGSYRSPVTGITYDKLILICDPNLNTGKSLTDTACIFYKSGTGDWIVPYWNTTSGNKNWACYSTGGSTEYGAIHYLAKYTSLKEIKDVMTIPSTYYIAGLRINNNLGDEATINRIVTPDSEYSDDPTEGIVQYDNAFLGAGAYISNDDFFALKYTSEAYKVDYKNPSQFTFDMDYENLGFTGYVDNTSQIIFKPDGTLQLKGDNAGYMITLLTNPAEMVTNYYSVTIFGDKTDNLEIAKLKDGYRLTSSNLNNIRVHCVGKNIDKAIFFKTDLDSVFIYEKEDSTIGIRTDLDNDGVYESELPKERNIDNCVVGVIRPQWYTGSAITPTLPFVGINLFQELFPGKDYTVSYSSNVEAGTATVIITGIGEYFGQRKTTFEILPRDLKDDCVIAKLTKSSFVYNGEEQEAQPEIYLADKQLVRGKDYTVFYENCKKVGTAAVIITGIGSCHGTRRLKYKIVPKGTKITKAEGTAGAFSLSWERQSTSAGGYQIEYSLSKDFSKVKKRAVRTNKTTKLTVTGLKPGKKYYVRIRTWKKVNGVNYFSSWSSAKAVKSK